MYTQYRDFEIESFGSVYAIFVDGEEIWFDSMEEAKAEIDRIEREWYGE